MSEGLNVEAGISDLVSLEKLFREIGNQAPHAIRRAVNWTGDKARTQVTRVLAKQTGAKYGAVRKVLSIHRASYGSMTYRIAAKGAHIPLKEFSPRQRRDGVSAAPWGRRVVFKRAFISQAMGGQVLVRVGKARLPVRIMWGPAIPIEMLKGQSKDVFLLTVATELPARVEHEVSAILKGYAPRG